MPKIIAPLTLKAIHSISRQGLTAIGGAPNLYLKVVGENRYFFFRYSFNSHRYSLSIGNFKSMTVAQARQKARELNVMIEQGIDPLVSRKKTKQTIADLSKSVHQQKMNLTRTFISVLRKYMIMCDDSGDFRYNEKKRTELEGLIRNHIEPVIKRKGLVELEPEDAFAIALPIFQNKPHTWDKVYSFCRQAYFWAEAQKWCTQRNPFDKDGPLGVLLRPLRNGQKKKDNFPALHYSSIPDFL